MADLKETLPQRLIAGLRIFYKEKEEQLQELVELLVGRLEGEGFTLETMQAGINPLADDEDTRAVWKGMVMGLKCGEVAALRRVIEAIVAPTTTCAGVMGFSGDHHDTMPMILTVMIMILIDGRGLPHLIYQIPNFLCLHSKTSAIVMTKMTKPV